MTGYQPYRTRSIMDPGLAGLFKASSTAHSSGAGSSSQATAKFGIKADSVACEPDPGAVAPQNKRGIALPAPPRLGEPRYGKVATAEEAIMVMEAMAARQASSSSRVERGSSGGPRRSPRSTNSRSVPTIGTTHVPLTRLSSRRIRVTSLKVNLLDLQQRVRGFVKNQLRTKC